ncbi:MAG: hypothetical protein LBI87_07600 [Candidatus Accumulibacter sp.]|jgi:transposase-like protein|nr:hypothetical protein [Accumulibacter sp.]
MNRICPRCQSEKLRGNGVTKGIERHKCRACGGGFSVTDADRCYGITFNQMKIKEPHTMTKRETCLIENSNSRIRDPLARFNRKIKRFPNPSEIR